MLRIITAIASAALVLGFVPAAAVANPAAPRQQADGPALAIGPVTVLRAQQRPLRLVRGVWTTVRVRINNPGTAAVTGVTLTGRGKGLQVRKKTVGRIAAGRGRAIELAVRLKGPRQATALRLTTRGSGAQAVRAIRVRRAAAPKAAVNGRYRSRDAARSVQFRVQNRRLVNFQVTMQMRCDMGGGRYSYPTTTWSFPTTPIPHNGIVHRRVRTTSSTGVTDVKLLELRIAGRQATRGRMAVNSKVCTGTKQFRADRFDN